MATRFMGNESRRLKQPWALFVDLHQPHVAYFKRKGFLAVEKYWDLYSLESIPMPRVPAGHLEDQHLVFQALRRFKRLATIIPERRIRLARAGYNGMISELDQYVGQIWDSVAATALLQRTVFVFTSGNGMSMGEHGLFYHNSLYEEAVHVPMVMTGGGLPRGVKVASAVSHVDAVATVLELGGMAVPHARLTGRSSGLCLQ